MPFTSPTSLPNPNTRPSSETLARLISEAAKNKKAEAIVALDLRGISTFTDFYVICSGNSEPQLKAIVEEIQNVLRDEHGVRSLHVDGLPFSQWIVADFGVVIVHIFHEAKRPQYALEHLWGDAPRLALPE
jgi:ribosome-associated protein